MTKTLSERWIQVCDALETTPDLGDPAEKAKFLQRKLADCRKNNADLLAACEALVRHCSGRQWVGQIERDKVRRDLITAAESAIAKAKTTEHPAATA